jgi:hypothetical protein
MFGTFLRSPGPSLIPADRRLCALSHHAKAFFRQFPNLSIIPLQVFFRKIRPEIFNAATTDGV